jgi:uncharacterized membrane protein (UPF0127 family)
MQYRSWVLRILRDFLIVVVGFLIVITVMDLQWFLNLKPHGEPQPKLPVVTLQIGKETIEAELAQTKDAQEKGLSFRPSLGPNEGMLFVFPIAGPQKFWMYGMNFSLDIVFIRGDRVLDYEENVPPPYVTYQIPATVTTYEEVDRVLELPGGRAAELGIGIGTRVEIKR